MTEPGDFADFVRRRSGPTLRAAWMLTGGDWALAEDLAQTALGESGGAGIGSRTWPRPTRTRTRSMVNTCLRWRGRRWTGEIAWPTFQRPPPAAEFQQVDIREALRGRTARADHEAARGHHAALLRGPDRSRDGDIMGCSVGTVKSQASKAMVRLRHAPGLTDILTGERRREQRRTTASELLGFVPDPPVRLSADQVTTRSVDPSAKSWAVPAMAAAAVAAIGVTVGLSPRTMPRPEDRRGRWRYPAPRRAPPPVRRRRPAPPAGDAR